MIQKNKSSESYPLILQNAYPPAVPPLCVPLLHLACLLATQLAAGLGHPNQPIPTRIADPSGPAALQQLPAAHPAHLPEPTFPPPLHDPIIPDPHAVPVKPVSQDPATSVPHPIHLLQARRGHAPPQLQTGLRCLAVYGRL